MSIIATAVKHLIAAGVTGDDLVRAIAEMEAQSVPAVTALTARQERNRRYYENVKASESRLIKTNSDDKDVSDAVSPASSPVPLVPPSQTLPPIIPQTPSPTPETKRARRLATDWVLPAVWGRWAISQGHSEATIRIEAEKFRDYWCSKSGKDATKLDWEATWRNWIRNASKPSGGRPAQQGPPRPKSEFMQKQDAVKRELETALGHKRDDDEFASNGPAFDLDQGNWRAH